jgi:hypothetical protein
MYRNDLDVDHMSFVDAIRTHRISISENLRKENGTILDSTCSKPIAESHRFFE